MNVATPIALEPMLPGIKSGFDQLMAQLDSKDLGTAQETLQDLTARLRLLALALSTH